MLPVIVADADWYQRARTRLYLDDAGYATAELAEGAMLLHLLQVQPAPVIVIVSTNLRLPDQRLVLGWLTQEPVLWQRHALVIIGAEQPLVGLPGVPVVALPLEREPLLRAITQAALACAVRPKMRLPIA